MSLSKQRKQFRYNAMTSAAEMIRSHGESGLDPEDLDLDADDEKGLSRYIEECKAVSKQITTMAERFKKKHKL